MANQPPQLDPIADQVLDEGAALSLAVSSFEPDIGGPARYSLGDGAPAGASIDPDSGVITWKPSESQLPGSYTITAIVADSASPSLIDRKSFTITLRNIPPSVSIDPSLTVARGSVLNWSGSFTDPGTEQFTGSVDYGDGTGPQPLALNPDKTFALSHAYSHVGAYTVTLVVKDQNGGTGTTQSTVTVTDDSITSRSGFGRGRDAFVTTLYGEQLGRVPEPAGLRYWSGRLAAGMRPRSVASRIWTSREHHILSRQHLAPPVGLKQSFLDALRAWHWSRHRPQVDDESEVATIQRFQPASALCFSWPRVCNSFLLMEQVPASDQAQLFQPGDRDRPVR